MNPQVLEKYRHEKGMTGKELARKMKRTPGWYSRIKDGKQTLPMKYVEPMAELFGVKPERLAKELFSANKLESDSSFVGVK